MTFTFPGGWIALIGLAMNANGGNMLSVLRYEKLEYITCYHQYGLIINNLNKLK